jgi:hypothetical protein
MNEELIVMPRRHPNRQVLLTLTDGNKNWEIAKSAFL